MKYEKIYNLNANYIYDYLRTDQEIDETKNLSNIDDEIEIKFENARRNKAAITIQKWVNIFH